ncbi:hypothetical protein BV210_00855 [Halorientalis sp. IM1011]|uniref:DUF7537 family lipoprotein n=1 Tax=Halorientalis sp. IM1011 TaxID=1932360 RepID=UPI00097CCAC6|nr:hypothetical protein [Halorientalis sp. IM1011]AQL41351.1 hypothetical protein BV210_00855 [Halorientalis sp. IM1011]
MRKRVLATLAVTVLVALAGCAGGPLGGEGTATDTDSGDDDRAIESETATVSSFAYPAGATPSGIENVSTLLDEHESALSGSSVTLSGTTGFSAGGSSNSASAGIEYTIEHEASSNETLTRVVGGDSGDTFTSYITDGTTAYRVNGSDGVEYGTAQASVDAPYAETAPANFTGRSVLLTILGSGEYNATDVVARNGTELVRYDLETVTETPEGQLNIGGDTEVNGTVFVDSDGIVHEAYLTASSGSEQGFSFGYEASAVFSDIDSTTVEEPEWTDEV